MKWRFSDWATLRYECMQSVRRRVLHLRIYEYASMHATKFVVVIEQGMCRYLEPLSKSFFFVEE